MSDSGCRYELFLREEVPVHAARRQRTLADRLDAAAEATTVREWPKRVRRWSDGDVLDRYDEFAAWADDAGVDLSPFFGSRGVYSFEDGRQFDALVLPVCCLAVYEGDAVTAVYPHAADDGTTRSVGDALDDIERSAGENEGDAGEEMADAGVAN